jgi:hypothetical protein
MSDEMTWVGVTNEAFEDGMKARVPELAKPVYKKTLEDLLNLHPLLRPPFKHWYETGEIQDMGVICGYTADDFLNPGTRMLPRMNKDQGLFILLDALIRDPEQTRSTFIRVYHDQINMPGRIKHIQEVMAAKEKAVALPGAE